MGEKKHWTSGDDKVWMDDGRHVLRLYKRTVRLLYIYKELSALKLPTFFVAYDLLRVYRKSGEGLDCGRYKLCDCEEIFTKIEALFESKNVEDILRRVEKFGWVLDDGMRKYLVSVGFLDDDVTRAVTREMLSKIAKGNRSDNLKRRDNRRGVMTG